MKIVNIMLTLLCVAVIVSCTKDELEVVNADVSTKSFATYTKNLKSINQTMIDAVKSESSTLLWTQSIKSTE